MHRVKNSMTEKDSARAKVKGLYFVYFFGDTDLPIPGVIALGMWSLVV